VRRTDAVQQYSVLSSVVGRYVMNPAYFLTYFYMVDFSKADLWQRFSKSSLSESRQLHKSVSVSICFACSLLEDESTYCAFSK